MKGYYIESIKKAVSYIEENLNKKISLNGISEASGISKFHIHRLFQAFTGDTIYDIVKRLKVENAAALLSSSKTIADIAKISGYSSAAELGHEFKNRFSKSPSAWRKAKAAVPEHPLIKTLEDTDEPKLLSMKIEKVDDFSIAYIRHTGAYAGDSALFIYLYNKLTAWAAAENLLSPEQQNVVIYHNPIHITEESRTKISIGISVPEDVKAGGDIGKMKLQGGEYLICRYSLHDEEYSSAWNRVYREFLPEKGLKLAEGFSFELYPSDVKAEDRYSAIVDIYVPVEKND